MPLFRVLRQPFGAFVENSDGRRGRSRLLDPPRAPTARPERMGTCCTRSVISRHTAGVDEILEVLWSDYHGAAILGDAGQIARIPHKGCRLEIVATATTAHHGVSLLLPGQVLRYKRSLFILDRLELPSGTKVGLWHFVGFRLRLLPNRRPPTPVEDIIVKQARGEAVQASPAPGVSPPR